jgi:hypothetical protein
MAIVDLRMRCAFPSKRQPDRPTAHRMFRAGTYPPAAACYSNVTKSLPMD